MPRHKQPELTFQQHITDYLVREHKYAVLEQSDITDRETKGSDPLISLRLSKALGRSPESWLAMQYNHDLWQAKQHVKLGKVGKVRLTAA